MNWTTVEPDLQAYIQERQAAALRTYEVNPDLLEEHVGQEDSFRSGGYGTRQVSELLQNAVDALTASKRAGRIEFRVADGALYCANEGEPFSQAGIRSVCMAFLSPKREEDLIGRFGLGFKSVLGITDNPQVFSHSVSFEFNAPSTAELFAGINAPDGRVPLMRVPSMIDPDEAAAVDPHLAELMTWATTVVKLPLRREGDRIRTELTEFKTETLLFMKSVSQLNVALKGKDGAPVVSSHKREGDLQSGQVVLHKPGMAPAVWLYAERQYEPDEQVLKTLPATIARKRMTVAYAVPQDGNRSIGEIWTWFPLKDQTTARGIFNAPWQVNDDRTTLIATSALNGAMLEVGAELFLEVVSRASTTADPAAHLDLFPARGRELRSAADGVLTAQIPRLARALALIPDASGTLRQRNYFSGVPVLEAPIVPVELMKKWHAIVGRDTIPHSSAFARGNERSARLRSLLRDIDGERSRAEVPVATWLEELASLRTPEAIRVACEIYLSLRDLGFAPQLIGRTRIAPVVDGGWAAPDDVSSALIPRRGEPVPEGITLLDIDAIDTETVDLLKRIGFGEVSADESARALSSQARADWSTEEWARLWDSLIQASAHAAIRALTDIRERGVEVLVRTRAGRWRRARQVLTDETLAQALDDRHPSKDLGNRGDLLRAAGCIQGPDPDFPVWEEAVFAEYATEMKRRIAETVKAQGHALGALELPHFTGTGPMQLFVELAQDEEALTVWTERAIRVMQATITSVSISLGRQANTAKITVETPEAWIIRKKGRVNTSLGRTTTALAAGSSLQQFSSFLPVLGTDLSRFLGRSDTLAEIGDATLAVFMRREGYDIRTEEIPRLTEILAMLARRKSLAAPPVIPALSNGTVVRRARADVVVASSREDMILLDEHQLAYVDGSADPARVLVEHWGMRTSEEALARSLEFKASGHDVLLVDRFPSLQSQVAQPLSKLTIRPCASIIRRSETANGTIDKRQASARIDDILVIDDSLDDIAVLMEVSSRLSLNFTSSDAKTVLGNDEALRRNVLVEQSRSASSDAERLLILVGPDSLRANLPRGFLDAVEGKNGTQNDIQIAQLFSRVKGFDSLWSLREELGKAGLAVPHTWAGSNEAQAFVVSLGFGTGYAGTRDVIRPALQQVPGRVDLKPLHDFQETLADRIRTLTLEPGPDHRPQRGLLFLPTGAGKTRVSVEAVVRMFVANELSGPVVWIAQSRELCEQAIQTWSDVWRAIGDERVLDLCRFWDKYEVDESNEELQVVVTTDDKLFSRIKTSSDSYRWLANASLVIIDEAHTAGTLTYTNILKWFGLTASNTNRPLLGLTATPYRGRNPELNRLFALRFGGNKLESLDPEDPIGQLRRSGVLADVEHYVLDGSHITAMDWGTTAIGMREVSKAMLDRVGQDMQRTQTVVDDILAKDVNWPILVFAASVSSAHTIAALLSLEGRSAAAVDGSMRPQERRRLIEEFRSGELQVLVNCDLLTQGFDAPKVRALYVARPTFSPNRYHQMIGRGLRGPKNGGKEMCLIVNVADTFEEFGEELAFTEFNYLWEAK
jgi:superfamily II DNA or RNA helicase